MAAYKEVDPTFPERLMVEVEKNGDLRRWASRKKVETEVFVVRGGLFAGVVFALGLFVLSGYMIAKGQPVASAAPLLTALAGGAAILIYRSKTRETGMPQEEVVTDPSDSADEHLEIGPSAERRVRHSTPEAPGRGR
jgi:hypothetical protein